MNYDAVIIGAGLAGLRCALKLHQSGISFLLIEKSDSIGGRVKTDFLNGYTLDRGFQALFTAYPLLVAQNLVSPLIFCSASQTPTPQLAPEPVIFASK